MKWAIVGLIVVLLLPFYVYVLSKSAQLGKLTALKSLFKERQNGKKEK